MKCKVKWLSVLITTILILGINAISVYAEEGEKGELPQKVIDIMNGSDEIYGEGVPLEHVNERYRFKSGGVNHTHQYILSSSLYILNHDKGNSVLNNNAAVLLENTDWPDKLGNETDAGTFAGHFYDPYTGKNWLGQTSPTAKTRAIDYYNKAVNSYKNGDISQAMIYLGRGTHYISDVNEPHHASNYTAVNSNHSEFEKYVDDNRNSYKISGNSFGDGIYNSAINTTLSSMIDQMAYASKNLYPEASQKATYSGAAEACVKNAIESVAQYLYKFGKEVGIY